MHVNGKERATGGQTCYWPLPRYTFYLIAGTYSQLVCRAICAARSQRIHVEFDFTSGLAFRRVYVRIENARAASAVNFALGTSH